MLGIARSYGSWLLLRMSSNEQKWISSGSFSRLLPNVERIAHMAFFLPIPAHWFVSRWCIVQRETN